VGGDYALSRRQSSTAALCQSTICGERALSGSRQSAHSQATDPFIDLMSKVFEKMTGDAAAQQAGMDTEIVRREREMADKVRLQLRVEQLERERQRQGLSSLQGHRKRRS